MKIAIIGAAGLRTPLMLKSILARQESLGLTELSLMDIDGERLELIGALSLPPEKLPHTHLNIIQTTDPMIALRDADFVITTFRIGGMESRLIDESVPLKYGILGQETTGPGGFAMGIRSIPVILNYVDLMSRVCPNAWLINFANPAGMLTEAVIRQTGWVRIAGICDAPSSMLRVIAKLISASYEDVYLDYFGLNHLGWIRKVMYQKQDYLPELICKIKQMQTIPGLPFDPQLISSLGLIPNEYLYYFYYARNAVNNIIKSGGSRGSQLVKLNNRFINQLKMLFKKDDLTAMHTVYQAYLTERGESYMVAETGIPHNIQDLDPVLNELLADEGYAGVALDLIGGLIGNKQFVQILNIANHGAIQDLEENDVVEIPAMVSNDHIQPLHVDKMPGHCLGLVRQVKEYEHLTIEASTERSYAKALLALTIHPLVQDHALAKNILDEYIIQYPNYFPRLV